MVLASHLLKHHLISQTHPDIPWHDIPRHLTTDQHKKPIFLLSDGTQPVSFNVSHQAGLVVLSAVAGYAKPGQEVDVGVDIVCTSERRDRDVKSILEDRNVGWFGFVEIYSEVFAQSEVNYLKYSLLSSIPSAPKGPGTTQEDVVDFKLRCFYTLWCLREAYVKMTGEALMAEWIRELEFRRFVPPEAVEEDGVGGREGTGEVRREHEIWCQGRRVDDGCQVDIRSWGKDYMLCTAVRTRPDKKDGLGLRLGRYEVLDLEKVLGEAEGRV
jgi:4'-phosphopantetheinyl transferase